MDGFPRHCWCGAGRILEFSEHYGRCSSCCTLISKHLVSQSDIVIPDKEEGLYAKDYWFQHMTELGSPDIVDRARRDLPERCLHWTHWLLSYKRPPGRYLELGCGPGAQVAMAQWAGFDAAGLELSPWVTNFARNTFDVQVHHGPLEQHPFEPESFDVVALFDVLEHLVDPLAQIRRCVSLLQGDGILIMQTPEAPENVGYGDLVRREHVSLGHMKMKEREHLNLFTKAGVTTLLKAAGCNYVAFIPPFQSFDMFLVASKDFLRLQSVEEYIPSLLARPSGRLVAALLDLKRQKDEETVGRLVSQHLKTSLKEILGPRLTALFSRVRRAERNK